MGVRALILINTKGLVGVQRQMEACWSYIQGSPHLKLAGLLRVDADPKTAAEVIRQGRAEVIVTAYRDPDMELTGEIEAVGGHVEYVQEVDRGRLTVRGIIASLHRRLGWSAITIARAIGGSPHDVSDHLRRSGIDHLRDK